MSVVGAPLDLITVVKPCVGKLEEVLTWAVDPDNTDLRLWRRVTFDAHGNVVELDLSDCDLDMDLETLAETLIISERLRVLKLSNNPKLTGDIGCFEGCQFTEVWLGGCIQITGDIGIFSTSPELTDLSLGAPSGGITGLTGDVAVLLDMPSLRRVWLHGALNLTGDIGAALEGKRYLVWFFCTACTKLTGSLVSFRTCPSLKYLDLSGCTNVELPTLGFAPPARRVRDDDLKHWQGHEECRKLRALLDVAFAAEEEAAAALAAAGGGEEGEGEEGDEEAAAG